MNNKITSTNTGILSLLLVTVIYGYFPILFRMIGTEQLPLFYQSGVRALFAAMLLALLLMLKRSWKKIKRKDLGIILIRGFFSVMSVIAFFIAFNALSVGTVYFISFAGATITGYLLGSLFFHERITKARVYALLFSLIGLYLIYAETINSTNLVYGGISLFSGFAMALWNILPKKIDASYSGVQLSFVDNMIGGGFALGISLFLKETWVVPSLTNAWILNAIIGTLFVATGLLVVYGFRRLDAQIGSLIMLMEVVFALIFSFLFYKEGLTVLTMTGGFCILLGILLPEIKGILTVFLQKRHLKR